MNRAIIAFGANLGDPAETYLRAGEMLSRTTGISRVVPSPLYRTDPVGGPDADLIYLNGALLLETSLTPTDLYQELVRIQQRLGRKERQHWGPRPIDLDLVWMENLILHTDELTIPHPRMHYRWFVLRPAADIASEAVHPIFGLTLDHLLERIVRQPLRIHFWGGSEQLIELARQELRSRNQLATTTHCPIKPQDITFQRLGDSLVGVTGLNQANHQEDSDVWQIIFAEDEPLTEGKGSIHPAVDARGCDDHERLNNFKIFLDSLRPGSRVTPEE